MIDQFQSQLWIYKAVVLWKVFFKVHEGEKNMKNF